MRDMLPCARPAYRSRPDQTIEAGLQHVGEEHAQGKWKIELADEDGQTALEKHLTARIGRRRWARASGPLAQ